MATSIDVCRNGTSNEQTTMLVTFRNIKTCSTRSGEFTAGPLQFSLQLYWGKSFYSVVVQLLSMVSLDVLCCKTSARLVSGPFSNPHEQQFTDVQSGSPLSLFVIQPAQFEQFDVGNTFVFRITIAIPSCITTIVPKHPSCVKDAEGIIYDRMAEHSLSRDLEGVVESASIALPMGQATITAGLNLRCEINALTLAARSPVFRTMLTSSMQEATTHEIHITDFSPEAVAAFVRFLHTDRCSHADLQAHIPHLLQLADKYQVPALGAVCAQYMRGALSCENALSVLKLADRCNAREVRQEALRYIAEHAGELGKLGVEAFEDLSAEQLRDILAEFGASKKQRN